MLRSRWAGSDVRGLDPLDVGWHICSDESELYGTNAMQGIKERAKQKSRKPVARRKISFVFLSCSSESSSLCS